MIYLSIYLDYTPVCDFPSMTTVERAYINLVDPVAVSLVQIYRLV